ncbi:MAG: HlyC/CorC family transporter [Lachnospiraceae bacterium]|nr:HlyC/CorC family transporter [Lachnospiraceae bacterium]
MPAGPWPFIILLVLICFSAFFSAAETALTSLSKIRLRNMVDDNIKNADKVAKITDDPGKLLSTILIGNNIVNICASSIATAIAISIDPIKGVGIATAFMTIVVLIFGEITPKTIAAQNSEKISLRFAGPIIIITKLLTPFVIIFNAVTGVIVRLFGADPSKRTPLITEAELKTMVDVSHEEGVLETEERQMINNVFEFGDSKAKDVMTPRTDIEAVKADISREELISFFKEEQFSRAPVYGEDIDDIIGIVYYKDVVFSPEEGFDIKDYIRDAFFTYESKGTSELFRIMRTKRIPVAIVVDEYGGTSGLVTLEDLVEEIVGEIADEYDEVEEDIEVVKEDEYIIDGSTHIDDVNEMIGTNIESEDFDTIGGFVIGVLGTFPEAGETVEYDGIRFVVEEIDKNRIEKLRIHT